MYLIFSSIIIFIRISVKTNYPHSRPQASRPGAGPRLHAVTLQAVDLATIAWHATRAGAGGVADLGCEPRLDQGGNAAKKVRKALGLERVEEEILHKIPLPVLSNPLH